MNLPQDIIYKDMPLSSIKINDPFFVNAFNKELNYLMSLEPDKLTAGFYETRGLAPKAEKYKGWESSEIQGHTIGHYLSAMAQGYENTKDKVILDKITYVIDELALCQFESGFLFASPESFFDRIEQKKPVWVPWYTMHKIIEGLVSVCLRIKSETVQKVLSLLADWIYQRTSRWDDAMQKTVLSVEYGGMNDCLYDTYLITGKDEHRQAAHMFDELPLFEQIRKGNDILCDLHANTTIPKFIGAMKRYYVFGKKEKYYLEAADSFWNMVVRAHTYITGGNSEWEHFGQPGILDGERTSFNCEMCNSYNMLKLSRGLFMITGEKKYLDFYENTYINAIAASQNPETGMTMYFQPMATGYFKVYGRPYDRFWCCTGTGMENFTKLNDGMVFLKDSEITISRYISSEIEWNNRNVKIKITSGFPASEKAGISIHFTDQDTEKEFIIRLRIPEWCINDSTLYLNGKDINFSKSDRKSGFITINRKWKANDQIDYHMPMKVSAHPLPDNKNAVAFTYGPYVLSAGLGNEEREISVTGVEVDIPTRNIPVKDHINIQNKTVQQWLDKLEENLVKTDSTPEFRLCGTDEDENLVFIPHFLRGEERYGIYWYLFGTDSDDLRKQIRTIEEEKQKIDSATIDKVPIGNDQYELQHSADGEETFADTHNGYMFREAKPGGWFSYIMKVDPESHNVIRLERLQIHIESKGELWIGQNKIANISSDPIHPPVFYSTEIKIPQDITTGKQEVNLKFINKHEENGFRIAGLLRILKEM